MERIQLAIDESDGVRTVRLGGDLDTFSVESLRVQLGVLRSSDIVIVDLSALEFVDSAGLHSLFRLGRIAKEVGAGIAFVVPPDCRVRRTVEVIRLGDVAPVCESVEAAIARLPAVTAPRV